jgi:uncharacterized membrane protein
MVMEESVKNISSKEHIHKEKFIITLMIIKIIFFCTFTVAFIALKNNYSLFNIGLPSLVENWIIIILSTVFIIKSIHELSKA